MEGAYYTGTGRRKTAVAQVRLMLGSGIVRVNGALYENVFGRDEHRRLIMEPFLASGTVGKYDVEARVSGGGISGQAGALRHGIARALTLMDEKTRPLLKEKGLLTRDPRAKERKKPGLRRARKAPQFTKR